MAKNKKKQVKKPVETPVAADTTPLGTALGSVEDPTLVSKWPELKLNVPALFLHSATSFKEHAPILIKQGVQFYRPATCRYHTKIDCANFADHRAMAQYFDKNNLPYHTYGHPNKRKLKVVIRGLPNDVNLNIIKEELKKVGIPVIRLQKMHTKSENKRPLLIFVVVPYDAEGKRIFLLRMLLGHDVTLEPVKNKLGQCHRCQKWGHSQRYCHGAIKCVKCAGDHFSKKCTRDPELEPPKCANCSSNHTANFRGCPVCPESEAHKESVALKATATSREYKPRTLVTMSNIDRLYRNVGYFTKDPSDLDSSQDYEYLDYELDEYYVESSSLF